MEHLKARDFFDIARLDSESARQAGWEHAEIFEGNNFVWEALKRLPYYVDLLFREGRVRNFPIWKRLAFWFSHVTIRGTVSIGKNCQIFPGAYIGNYVIIGDNCIIGQNATIRDYSILSAGCRVGPSGEVAKSIFLPGAAAAHKNFIGNSIMGRNVNLGAGAETGNWKLKGGEIGIKFGEGYIQTGMDHLGAIVGDGTSVGGNTVFDPGALVGKNCTIDSLVQVPNGYTPEGKAVINPSRGHLIIKPRKSRPAPQ